MHDGGDNRGSKTRSFGTAVISEFQVALYCYSFQSVFFRTLGYRLFKTNFNIVPPSSSRTYDLSIDRFPDKFSIKIMYAFLVFPIWTFCWALLLLCVRCIFVRTVMYFYYNLLIVIAVLKILYFFAQYARNERM